MTTRRRAPTASALDDRAFDEALAHISLLAACLDRVRSLHRPRSTLLGVRRCANCGRRYPCPTLTCLSDQGRGLTPLPAGSPATRA